MSLYRVALREEAARALRAAGTLAGENVFTARSWPLTTASLPAIFLQVLQDDAESLNRSAPLFRRTASLMINAQVAYTRPGEGESLLDAFCEQIEMTIMLDVALQKMVQQVSRMRTELSFDSTTSSQVGTARMLFDLEFSQTFRPSGVPLTSITAQIKDELTGTTLANVTVPIPSS